MLVILCMFALLLLAGCQRNVDGQGNVLPERIIYLDTPWSAMLNESILTAVLVYPLAQLINFIGGLTGSGVLGVVITTLLYNVLTIALSIKSTVSSQKMQMIQPELNKIQAKYEGRNDDNSRMQMYQEQQALMQKYGVNPMASLGSAFLQFPIMIAMFYAAQRADVVVNGTFLGVPLQKTPWDGFTNIKEYWPLVLIFVINVMMMVGHYPMPQGVSLAGLCLPVVGALAIELGLNPIVVCLPVCMSTSMLLLVPIDPTCFTTYSGGYWKIKDMMGSGVIITIAYVIIASLITALIAATGLLG